MELLLHIILIAIFLTCATVLYIGYERVESWWHFRTWDRPHSTFNWPVLALILAVPVLTGAAMIVRYW